MKITEIKYFEWADVQREICKEMGIEESDFRDYQNVTGGAYKDLWHEWINLWQHEIIDGMIVPVMVDGVLDEHLECYHELKQKWIKPFFDAVETVFDNYDIKYVRYCW